MTVRTLLAGSAGLLLVACGGDEADLGHDRYNPELRAEFVVSCVAQGTPQDQCGCLYDKLEAEIPFARYEEVDAAIRTGRTDIPTDIAALAASCAISPSD
jgi:hypothetical protein